MPSLGVKLDISSCACVVWGSARHANCDVLVIRPGAEGEGDWDPAGNMWVGSEFTLLLYETLSVLLVLEGLKQSSTMRKVAATFVTWLLFSILMLGVGCPGMQHENAMQGWIAIVFTLVGLAATVCSTLLAARAAKTGTLPLV
eukprot:TRINITY_DN1715_c1_g3_i7.p3 TRINITY_DN1715_c1_g3~~TRINITY_DN1715_c1_g3_i7.p3  ORF type:complete len:143 (-),score=23.27 TRINITY_DN1715_c1_g3_i7:433-861(-)